MANKKNLGIGAIIVILIAAFFGIDLQQFQTETRHDASISSKSTKSTPSKDAQTPFKHENGSDDVAKIERAFRLKQRDVQVRASGRVIAILPDDNEGSRHQKFILKLSNEQTLLVAHNIDLAPRIANIQKDDKVEFFGEYEYSDKGGVIHWTHHDPADKHVSGWLKHQGRTYQ